MQPPTKLVYRLDGSEAVTPSTSDAAAGQVSHAGVWDGTRLIITTLHLHDRPQEMPANDARVGSSRRRRCDRNDAERRDGRAAIDNEERVQSGDPGTARMSGG